MCKSGSISQPKASRLLLSQKSCHFCLRADAGVIWHHMSKPTPSELRKRERGIRSFDGHWYIDAKTSEIKHISLEGWSKFIDLFWRKKHKVSDLYWWSSNKWATSEMMPFDDAIRHDDVPIAGFPRKHQMRNGWTIPSEDLKYLYEGPLVDETGHKILVKHQSKIQRLVSVISQLRPLSWIIPLILAFYRYRAEFVELWEKLSNAI